MNPTLAIDFALQNVLDQVRGAWRFRWIAMIVAWVVAVVAWGAIIMMPDTYRAQARVFLDTRTALSEVTRGISVETDVESQILRVRQALLGGPQLQKVAAESDLLLDARTPRAEQQVVEGLRDKIKIERGGNSASAGVYIIAFENPEREMALRVVDRLLNTFVESTLGGKRDGSATAERFLRDQIAEYEKRLGEAEARLATFKQLNVGLMPGAQGDYFTRLQAEEEALAKAQAALDGALRRRDELGRQLRGEQPFLTSPAGSGQRGGPMPSVPMAADNDTASRIREAQARLDDLLLRYTDSHPDVIALKSTLAELQQRQESEIAAVRRGDAGAAARTGLTANPVFQNIQLQYNQTAVEIAAMRAAIADLQRRIGELRGLVNTAPAVEAEFAKLNRDYDVTQKQYQQLLTRLEQTRLGDDAQQTGVVRFEVIDPPTAGFDPVAPNRPVLIMFALLFALATGGGVAYLLHMLKPVITSARQLTGVTGLPVLGEVSMTWLDRYRATWRHGMVRFAATAGALVVLGIVVLLVQWRVVEMVREFLA